MNNILFLDDMQYRHDEFSRIVDHMSDVLVSKVYTASAAIALLETEPFDQVFLDHDLALDEESSEPTGMTVVYHILTMPRPPVQVIVHSCNGPAATMMAQKLESHPAGIWVRRIPFPELLNRMMRVFSQR